MNLMHYILTCDLKGSRKLKNRDKVQEELKIIIKRVNEIYRDNLSVPFMIVWGDAFQGALKNLEKLYEIIEYFITNFSAKFRCGLGIGKITTKISQNTLEMDGPAFHNSQKALAIAKEDDRKIWVITENKKFDNMINTIFILVQLIKDELTDRQKEIIYLRRQGHTYEEIGKRTNITKQGVYGILKAAKWESLKIAEQTLNNLEYWDKK